jgi:hypothetical protein
MATTLTVNRLSFDFGGSFANDDAFAPASVPLALKVALLLGAGSGADQVNIPYAKRRTLAATTSENLDLSAVLTDPLSGVISFAKVRAMIFFLHAGTNMGPLLIGGHATASFRNWITGAPDMDTAQPKVRLRNSATGGLFVLTGMDSTGFAVTTTTQDLLKVENEGSALCTYDVVILGA